MFQSWLSNIFLVQELGQVLSMRWSPFSAHSVHWYKSARAVPGSQPGCQWSNFSWPGMPFSSVACINHVASPEFFRDFLVLIWCTFSQAGLFQDVPLPQPGILRVSWKFIGCICSQPGIFQDVPLPQPGILRVSWKFIGCTCSQPGLFPDVPLPQPGILRVFWKFVGYTFSQPGLFRDCSLP